MNPETRIQSAILAALAAIPDVRAWRNAKGARGHHALGLLAPGSSDIIGLVKARFLALEVKVPGETATVEQLQFIADVRSLGGFADVVHSVDEALRFVLEARKAA